MVVVVDVTVLFRTTDEVVASFADVLNHVVAEGNPVDFVVRDEVRLAWLSLLLEDGNVGLRLPVLSIKKNKNASTTTL